MNNPPIKIRVIRCDLCSKNASWYVLHSDGVYANGCLDCGETFLEQNLEIEEKNDKFVDTWRLYVSMKGEAFER